MIDKSNCRPPAPVCLTDIFKGWAGCPATLCSPLSASGGDRRYWRLVSAGGRSAIGCIGTDVSENRAFVSLARTFRAAGCRVPEIYAVSDDAFGYLQQDLGDESLFSLLQRDGAGACHSLVQGCMRDLARLQTVPDTEWRGGVTQRPFSERLVAWDLNYFKYEYLRPSALPFDEDALQDDFDALAGSISGMDRRLWGFMYRDCQSRNVMLWDGEPWWIDFQGGRLGPCLYDAVSFLYQARAPFDEFFRREMLAVYAGQFAQLRGVTPAEVLATLGPLRLLRCLQVLGAYGLRGLIERRAHFVRSIPGALRNLRALLDDGVLDLYPELRRICALLAEDSRFATLPEGDGLTVTVFSFSYMRGYPADYSGNGGGHMFDCRAMHNPGRYEEYRQKTGLDREVIDFLEARGEVQSFLENAWRLVGPTVKRYLDRGFSSLQVGFGCTGGRHRSVYCCQHLAERVKREFPAAGVRVVHREQGIDEILS